MREHQALPNCTTEVALEAIMLGYFFIYFFSVICHQWHQASYKASYKADQMFHGFWRMFFLKLLHIFDPPTTSCFYATWRFYKKVSLTLLSSVNIIWYFCHKWLSCHKWPLNTSVTHHFNLLIPVIELFPCNKIVIAYDMNYRTVRHFRMWEKTNLWKMTLRLLSSSEVSNTRLKTMLLTLLCVES